MTVCVVAVAPAEHDAYFAMMREYMRELDAYDPAGPESDADFARRRARTFADMEGRELLWIEADGARAGLAMVRSDQRWLDPTQTVASIAEFYVLPAFRRRGVGSEAVRALLEEHRRRGTAEIQADILRDNVPARAFWARLGFEVQMLLTSRRP
ncbi:MAG: GNAT family N-acetyltransferase [Chloroflexi bacterium]|nr:GNAT family N-acetyltransferase [Chloroflexota bacterium]